MKKWIATQEEIIQGKTTDVYFRRTKEILEKDGLEKTKVWAEVTTGGIPREGNRLIFLGLQDVLNLFVEAKLNIDVYSIDEGTILPNKDNNGIRIPFMVIEGEAEAKLSGNKILVNSGEMLIMPANKPHTLKATERFKMLLIMIKS